MRISARLRFEKNRSARLPLPFRFRMNFRILRHNLPHLGHFFSSISSFYFPVPQVGKTSHRPGNKRPSSTFFKILLPISVEGIPLPPMYTQLHPRSRTRGPRHARSSRDGVECHPRLKDSEVGRAFYSEILSTRGPRHARSSRDGVDPRPWSSHRRSFRAVRSKPGNIRQRVAPV
jgi:hypothetical protein